MVGWIYKSIQQFPLCFQRNGEVEMRKNTSKVLPFRDPNFILAAKKMCENSLLQKVSEISEKLFSVDMTQRESVLPRSKVSKLHFLEGGQTRAGGGGHR